MTSTKYVHLDFSEYKSTAWVSPGNSDIEELNIHHNQLVDAFNKLALAHSKLVEDHFKLATSTWPAAERKK